MTKNTDDLAALRRCTARCIAHHGYPTAILLVAVGLVVNVVTTTGLGNAFSVMIVDWAGGSLLLTLVLVRTRIAHPRHGPSGHRLLYRAGDTRGTGAFTI